MTIRHMVKHQMFSGKFHLHSRIILEITMIYQVIVFVCPPVHDFDTFGETFSLVKIPILWNESGEKKKKT